MSCDEEEEVPRSQLEQILDIGRDWWWLKHYKVNRWWQRQCHRVSGNHPGKNAHRRTERIRIIDKWTTEHLGWDHSYICDCGTQWTEFEPRDGRE